MEKTLWEQFNFQDPRDAGGLLYCLRYSEERLEAHRDQVRDVLKKEGISLVEDGRLVKVNLNIQSGSLSFKGRVALLEELSDLNEALTYKEAGINCRNISELKDRIIVQYLCLLDGGNLVDAYNLMDLEVPRMVSSLIKADSRNNVLNSKDRQYLRELGSFASRQVDLLNRPGGMVIFG